MTHPKATILFVDDEPKHLKNMQRFFENLGYRVLTALDGETALNYLTQEKSIAVLIADVKMPGMNGFQLLEKARDVSPDTARILMTALRGDAMFDKDIGCCQMFRILNKPVNIGELVETVRLGEELFNLVSAADAENDAGGAGDLPGDPAASLGMEQGVAYFQKKQEPDSARQKGKILIVDDRLQIRELVYETLSGVGDYMILTAQNGEQALELVRKEKPQLVFMDVMMPGALDGYEVTKILKEDTATRHIKIVMLTAKGQRTDFEKGLEVGADDYFTKPFSPVALIEKVEKIML